MKAFDVAQEFIQQHSRKVALADLKGLFSDSLRELGARYFACCPHADPLAPGVAAMVFQTYPSHWVKYFSESGRYRFDPVFQHAERVLVPFFWDDPAFRDSLTALQREILAEAAEYGLEHGYTVPIHSPSGMPASCSVVPDSESLAPGACQAVFTMACFMYEAMLSEERYAIARSFPRPRLSDRERQCLELAAQGKDDWTIGSILCISEHTAHNHIERAKRRFGVGTRVQVIVHALQAGQLSFGDVIKARSRDQATVYDLDAERVVRRIRWRDGKDPDRTPDEPL